MKDILTQSGSRLRNLRAAKNLSLRELSELAAVSRGTLSLAERGMIAVTAENLVRICAALGVSIDYLLLGRSSSDTDKSWRKLSSTKEGQRLRQVVMDASGRPPVAELWKAVHTLKDDDVEILLSVAKALRLRRAQK